MSIIQDIRARHTNDEHAARELGRGLMRGKRDELKLGYSWENAALVAIDAYGLSEFDTAQLRLYLYGFALGLHEAHPNAIDKRGALRTGFEHGQGSAKGSYPAELDA
jgi:hypothetical protein